MKPDAAEEYRGTFNPIQTNVPGVSFCEHLPHSRQVCRQVRDRARRDAHAGRTPTGAGVRQHGKPTVGLAAISRLWIGGFEAAPRQEDLPSFVAIPNSNQQPGYLGVKYAPLNTAATPRPGQPFSVRGLSLSGGLSVSDVQNRQRLLTALDRKFGEVETNDQLLDGLDRFGQQAHTIITSRKARDAFDVSRETPSFAKPFGEDPFGMSCLLATRLIESGVRFVTISLGGWDTHQNNFTSLRDRLLPKLDVGLAALLCGLSEKGLLKSTAVMVTGEFGRTPKINSRSAEGGRDHYPRCMFMLMAGGSVRGGQVIGASDRRPRNRPPKAILLTTSPPRSITIWESTTPKNITPPPVVRS